MSELFMLVLSMATTDGNAVGRALMEMAHRWARRIQVEHDNMFAALRVSAGKQYEERGIIFFRFLRFSSVFSTGSKYSKSQRQVRVCNQLFQRCFA